MKRKREEEIPTKNHLFDTIFRQPDILNIILPYIDTLASLLSFYRYLYYNMKDVEPYPVLTVMEKYLVKTVDLDCVNYYFLQKKMRKFTLNDKNNWPNKGTDHYIKTLQRYNEFRFTRNFVIYGFCIECNKLPPANVDAIHSDFKIINFNKTELESGKCYLCKGCAFNEKIWYTDKEVMDKMGLIIITSFMEKHGIRFSYNPNSTFKFFGKDVRKVEYDLFKTNKSDYRAKLF